MEKLILGNFCKMLSWLFAMKNISRKIFMFWKYLNIQDLNLKRGFRNRLNKMYKQEFPIQHKDDIDRDKTTLMERRRQHRCFSYCFYRVTIQILQGNRAGYTQRMKKDCYSLFPQCFSKIFKQNLIEDFYQQNKCFNF